MHRYKDLLIVLTHQNIYNLSLYKNKKKYILYGLWNNNNNITEVHL